MDVERLLESSAWVRSLAASLVSDPHDADDLVQETWAAALRRPPRAEAAHRSWLRRVLRNFATIGFRSRSRRLARERLAARPEAVSGPQESIERAELARRLVEKVLELEEPGRTAIILRYFDGLTAPEIAERLGLKPGAVRMRLKRALDQLRRKLGDDPVARDAWRGLLLAPLAAIEPPPSAPPLESAAAPPLLPSGAGPSLLARAALLVCSVGAGCLIGSRLAEIPAGAGAAIPAVALDEDGDARVLELEERLEAVRNDLERETAWRLELEARLRSTREAVARLTRRVAAFEDIVADPA